MTANVRTTESVAVVAPKTKLMQGLAALFTFLVMCPYIAPIPLGSDTQPYALITALALIATVAQATGTRTPTTRYFLILGFVTLYSIAISMILQSFFFRGIVGYASLVVIGWATFLMFRFELFSVKLFERVVLLWIGVSVVQLLAWRGFATQILARATTTDTRGVVGLAPEPSYHGITAVFFFVIFLLLSKGGYIESKRARVFQLVVFLEIAFLAQSATALLMMLIYYVVYCLTLREWKRLAYLIVGTVIGAFILISGITGSRVAVLVQMVMRNPALISSTDVSVGDRVGSIWLCIWGFIKDFPSSIVGHGTNEWTDFVNANVPLFPQICSQVTPGRILSGFGSGIFELGVIGLLIPGLLLKSFYAHRDKSLAALGIFVTICMFAAIPLAFPLYSFVFGFSEALRIRGLSRDGKTLIASPDEQPMLTHS